MAKKKKKKPSTAQRAKSAAFAAQTAIKPAGGSPASKQTPPDSQPLGDFKDNDTQPDDLSTQIQADTPAEAKAPSDAPDKSESDAPAETNAPSDAPDKSKSDAPAETNAPSDAPDKSKSDTPAETNAPSDAPDETKPRVAAFAWLASLPARAKKLGASAVSAVSAAPIEDQPPSGEAIPAPQDEPVAQISTQNAGDKPLKGPAAWRWVQWLRVQDTPAPETPSQTFAEADNTATKAAPEPAQPQAADAVLDIAAETGEAAASPAPTSEKLLREAYEKDELDTAPQTTGEPAPAPPELSARFVPTRRPSRAKTPKKRPSLRQISRQKRRRKRTRSPVGLFVAGIFKLLFVFGCLLLIALSIAAVQVASYMVEATNDDDTLLDLESIKLNQTSYFYAANPDNPNALEENDWVMYQELVGPEHRIWVPIDQIPDALVDAVIAIEDREFEEHHGVSFRRTFLATVNEFIPISDRSFGASTIEQQLIKNITGEKDVVGESGYKRKIREIYRAWGLDNRYTKEMIMEAYLNTISLSGTIGGVEAGAQEYFGKSVNQLSLAECALIAGITRAPGAYNPYLHPEAALNRRNSVLGQMLETGKITKQQHDEAVATPLGLVASSAEENRAARDKVFSYFSDQLFEDVVRDLMRQKDMTVDEAQRYLYTGGLHVYSTVDIKVQTAIEDVLLSGYDDDGFLTLRNDPRTGKPYKDVMTIMEEQEDGSVIEVLPQVAMSIIDYDGALKGVVGGVGHKERSLVLNRATQSPRQVGSTMKPIAAYSLGIDGGYIHYSSPIEDSGVRFRDGREIIDAETGQPRYNWPRNVSGKYRNSTIPVISAIAESTNTVAVKVGMRVGVPDMFSFLTDTLEISTLESEGAYNDLDYGPLVLGSLTHGITTYELAGAYMMFGNGGVHKTLHSYYQVLDSQGNLVLEPEVVTVQAVSSETAYVMNRMLYAVTHNGVAPGVSATARGMGIDSEMESIGKTGTTNEDKDRWFVGMTPYYVGVVWWGYDDNYEIAWGSGGQHNITTNVWKTVMEDIHEELEYAEFPQKPEGVTEASFCVQSGDIAGPGCPNTSTGYYTSQRLPGTCAAHNGGEGSEYYQTG